MEADLEHAIGLRQEKDAGQLLARLESDLVKAATPKGVQGARRRFLAEVVLHRHRYGEPHHGAWDAAQERGEREVASRLAEMRRRPANGTL